MRMGVAVWNYSEKPFLENIEHFASAGVRAVSAVGGHFLKQDGATLDAFAESLRRHDLLFTLHHRLPHAEDGGALERFPAEADFARRWHEKHRLLTGFTFDVKGECAYWLPLLRRVLEMFKGTGVFIACEDFPRDREQLRQFDRLDEDFPDLGILIDLGHMNMRIAGEGEVRARAARDYLRAVPLTIRELHIHDNDGQRDQHNALGRGTLPVDAAGAALREIGFDGISTIEFVPHWNDIHGEEGYRLSGYCRVTWQRALLGGAS